MGTPLVLEAHTMHSVWGMLEWIGNTLIFLLAGLLIGAHIIFIISAIDVAMIFAVYLILQVHISQIHLIIAKISQIVNIPLPPHRL
jgi:hypothetical protein